MHNLKRASKLHLSITCVHHCATLVDQSSTVPAENFRHSAPAACCQGSQYFDHREKVTMTSNVLCKFYMNGACHFGDQCRFSHNRQDEASQVCKYYLQGNCAYGDKCRYEHSKPSWSGRGQPAAPSYYRAPPAVPKPPVGGADESNPNWDDYMTPDEMDEFEKWQDEQEQAEAGAPGDEFGEIVDPADIPLCSEFGETGQCSAGEDCIYVHGDMCEICGYYCVHPYNPDWTAQHQKACREYVAAAAAAAGPQGGQPQQQRQQQQQVKPEPAPAADADIAAATAAGALPEDAAVAMESSTADVAAEADVADADVAAAGDESSPEVQAAVAAAVEAVVQDATAAETAAAAADVADKLAETHINN